MIYHRFNLDEQNKMTSARKINQVKFEIWTVKEILYMYYFNLTTFQDRPNNVYFIN